jgi:chromosome segregation ATPase
MQNIQVLRYMATLESRLNNLTANPSSGVVDLTEINNRLSSVENRLKALEDNKSTNLDMNNELVNLTEINNRLQALETTNNDLSVRLSAIETKPDLLQRLSALELTVATLNNNNNS